jgi:hypothetical protein
MVSRPKNTTAAPPFEQIDIAQPQPIAPRLLRPPPKAVPAGRWMLQCRTDIESFVCRQYPSYQRRARHDLVEAEGEAAQPVDHRRLLLKIRVRVCPRRCEPVQPLPGGLVLRGCCICGPRPNFGPPHRDVRAALRYRAARALICKLCTAAI